jgi:surface protein
MKNLLYLLFAIVLFSCSNSEDSNTEGTNTEDTNPVYLDDNGKTVRAKDWAKIGDSGLINGVLYTIVTRDFLTVENDLTRVCTSRITTMDNLFKDKSNFNQDISSWDVSNVTNMEWNVFGCISFQSRYKFLGCE